MVINAKQKRPLSPLSKIIQKSGMSGGTISDINEELSHGGFAPFTSRDQFDEGVKRMLVMPQMGGVKVSQPKIVGIPLDVQGSADLTDVIPK